MDLDMPTCPPVIKRILDQELVLRAMYALASHITLLKSLNLSKPS